MTWAMGMAGVARGIAALTPWGTYQSACIHELTFHSLYLKLHVAMSVIMPMLLTPSKCIHRGIAPKVLFI